MKIIKTSSQARRESRALKHLLSLLVINAQNVEKAKTLHFQLVVLKEFCLQEPEPSPKAYLNRDVLR